MHRQFGYALPLLWTLAHVRGVNCLLRKSHNAPPPPPPKKNGKRDVWFATETTIPEDSKPSVKETRRKARGTHSKEVNPEKKEWNRKSQIGLKLMPSEKRATACTPWGCSTSGKQERGRGGGWRGISHDNPWWEPRDFHLIGLIMQHDLFNSRRHRLSEKYSRFFS